MTTFYQATLLVVDDVPDNVKVLLKFLSKAGFKVLAAKEGEQAFRVIEQIRPDLILLDIMMPGIDGFEVCKILKSKPETRDIPIIFMTALADTTSKIKGFSLGAADYITKPVQYEEVLARVNAHLNLHRLQTELEEQNQRLLYEIRLRKEIEGSLQNTNSILAERTMELQKRSFELEERNRELDAFAHTVAHDLKNPLTGIVGVVDLLNDFSIDHPRYSEFSRYLRLLSASNQQMLNIIEALLLLAGVSRQIEFEAHTLNMSVIVAEVLDSQAFLLEEYRGTVEVPKDWPIAKGYAPWIREVWVNFITNGLKYGGSSPTLTLGATVQPNQRIRFWIRDRGPGLSEEARNCLFTPFTRLHQQHVQGYGLGLSIVKHIVEKLGGEVGVESNPGEGCLFYFTLEAC